MKLLLLLIAVGAALAVSTGCKGPAQPSLYSDVTAIEFDGQTGGAVRVGFNVPLGVGFREPPASRPGALARRQLGATLALVESLEKRAADPADPAPDGAAGTPGPAASEALHVEDQAAAELDEEHLSLEHAAEVREEVDAWGWDAIGKFAILGLILGALYATWRVLNARWPRR